jgi:hypothetical protein
LAIRTSAYCICYDASSATSHCPHCSHCPYCPYCQRCIRKRSTGIGTTSWDQNNMRIQTVDALDQVLAKCQSWQMRRAAGAGSASGNRCGSAWMPNESTAYGMQDVLRAPDIGVSCFLGVQAWEAAEYLRVAARTVLARTVLARTAHSAQRAASRKETNRGRPLLWGGGGGGG